MTTASQTDVGLANDAIQLAQTIEDLDNREEIYITVTNILLEQKKLDLALKIAEKFLNSYAQVEAYKAICLGHIEQKNLREALQIARKCQPELAKVETLAAVTKAVNESKSAEDLKVADLLAETMEACRALSYDHEQAAAWIEVGAVQLTLEDHGSAKQNFVNAIKCFPTYVETHEKDRARWRIACKLVKAELYSDAIAQAKELDATAAVRGLKVENVSLIRQQIALAHIRAGRYEEATAAARGLDAIHILKIHQELALAHLAAGRHESAMIELHEARSLEKVLESPDLLICFHTELSITYFKLHKETESKRHLQEALKLIRSLVVQKQTDATFTLAYRLFEQEMLQQSLQVLQQIDDPARRCEAAASIAQALMFQGKLDQATTVIDTFCLPDNTFPDEGVLRMTGSIQAKRGLLTEAFNTCEKMRQSDGLKASTLSDIVTEQGRRGETMTGLSFVKDLPIFERSIVYLAALRVVTGLIDE